MFESRKWRTFLLAAVLLLLGAVVGFSYWRESVTCMGVQLLTQNQMDRYTEVIYADYSDALMFNDAAAAVDLESSTIYITQDIDADSMPQALEGTLRISDPGYQLYFAPDAAFDDLEAAVAEGHRFQLLVTNGSSRYMQYNVIFTTLPVLRMDSNEIFMDELGREIKSGELCLWTPEDSDTGRYSVKDSALQWRLRGGASTLRDKTSWKISLKDKNGANRDIAFLGLGADDDWILNPMCFDDSRLKEKTFMTLWNQLAAQTDWNDKMSAGEYVEVVINDEYMGVYMLQRRVDDKFLELGEDDVLLKSTANLSADSPQAAYEIIYSSMDAEETYALMADYFYGNDYTQLQMDNFMDVNLMLQAASAIDNVQKNTFLILRSGGAGYCLTLLPWDTDMSWGIIHDEQIGFSYDYAESLSMDAQRVEYDPLKRKYPDLDKSMAQRWFALRQDVLSAENVLSAVDFAESYLKTSGAGQREKDRWGEYYPYSLDNPENLRRITQERLLWLDDYYSQYLN